MTMTSPAQARAELLETLGTESGASWVEFMQTVTRLLPGVLSAGRPSAEAIRGSLIGELGFGSWADMIEAPLEAGGLGWNISAWKAWRRAWAVVQEHPWLLSAGLSSSEINTLAQECKRDGLSFPVSAEALEALRNARRSAQEARKGESLAGAIRRAESAEIAAQAAEDALLLARADVNALRAQLTVAQERNESLARQLGRLASERDLMASGNLWQRLLWAFRGFPSSTPVEVREARRARSKRQALRKKASRAAGSQEGE